jgi:beta-1,4-mannosyltransferase
VSTVTVTPMPAAAQGTTRVRPIASFPPAIPENPYQQLLYAELERHGFTSAGRFPLKARALWRARRERPVLHFHWPQGYYVSPVGRGLVRTLLTWVRLAVFAGRLLLARVLRFRIVWTVHEVFPHERAGHGVDRAGGLVLSRASHVLLVHDRATAEHAQRAFRLPERRFSVIPHGTFTGVYPEGRDRATVRAELGLGNDTVVFLAFGHVRAYKRLDVLIDAFAALERDDVALVVAGVVVDEEAGDEVRAAAERDRRIVPLLAFLPDDQVSELFGASDVAVISRSDGGTSGALILAMSLGIPVVSSANEAYDELTGGEDAAWFFTPGDTRSLTDALARAAGDGSRAEKAANARERCKPLSWEEIGARTAALIRG